MCNMENMINMEQATLRDSSPTLQNHIFVSLPLKQSLNKDKEQSTLCCCLLLTLAFSNQQWIEANVPWILNVMPKSFKSTFEGDCVALWLEVTWRLYSLSVSRDCFREHKCVILSFAVNFPFNSTQTLWISWQNKY